MTRVVLRHRNAVLAAWGVVLAAGVAAAVALPGHLATSFAVPGTESQRAQAILQQHFGERPDGTVTVVFRVAHPSDKRLQRRLRNELAAAARAVPTGHVEGSLRPGGGILYGDVATTLDLQHAKGWTVALRQALHRSGGPPALVTGQPAIQHDLDPVLASALRSGYSFSAALATDTLLAVSSRGAVIESDENNNRAELHGLQVLAGTNPSTHSAPQRSLIYPRPPYREP